MFHGVIQKITLAQFFLRHGVECMFFLKCTQKSCFGRFRVGKFDTLMLKPPRKSIPSEKHVIWCKNDGNMSLRLFSRAWQEITKLKKLHDKVVEHYISPLCQGVPAGPIVVRFYMLGGTHDVITRTKF